MSDAYEMPDLPDPCRAELRTPYPDQPDGECSLDVNHDGLHECGYTGYRWSDDDRGAGKSYNPRAAS